MRVKKYVFFFVGIRVIRSMYVSTHLEVYELKFVRPI